MGIIYMKIGNPIVQRAMALHTVAMTEVGFVPNDPCGCKIYASNSGGLLRILAIHNRTYGCRKRPGSERVLVDVD